MTSSKTSPASPSTKAIEFARQAERLGYRLPSDKHDIQAVQSEAIEAKFVTAQDPVIETAGGDRLPTVPVHEALKLNKLKDEAQGKDPAAREPIQASMREARDGTVHGAIPKKPPSASDAQSFDTGPLRDATIPTKTNPLFPPLPLYGPPSYMKTIQCYLFRATSSVLSLAFLTIIMLGAMFTSIPNMLRNFGYMMIFMDPHASRPFYQEEKKRNKVRQQAECQWAGQANLKKRKSSESDDQEQGEDSIDSFPPLEGGPDKIKCDARYYARRVGLDMESFDVQTEDGFIIQLWHVFNPHESTHAVPELHRQHSAQVFRQGGTESGRTHGAVGRQFKDGQRKYPVLMMHGLLQSAGAYCCTDNDSLAFFLAKSGYDVWLGNNRCGFSPRHNMLKYGDPRMWAWNIRQMGVMDLPALVSRVLSETGFEKLGLICHSQGTTEAFVALAKEQRPDIGQKISVFCALAPAVYAGPLIKKVQFKFFRAINPAMFRMIFGIHAFIPFMMLMHRILPARIYAALGYRVFAFLFHWSDKRWERALRDRMFQFSPVYVSAESMRWWLGRECFAKHKCILATKAEGRIEDEEDREEDDYLNSNPGAEDAAELSCHCDGHYHAEHGRYSWYDERAPPMAFWICGADDLVDGKRLLRRFDRGREPHVNLVHSKIIEEYEHLDVIWAMDAIDKVGKEVRQTLWRTAPAEARRVCRVPSDCENLEPWEKPVKRTDG